MNELREKCILFISNNLESILQVPCVFSSIPERLLAKIAACVPVVRLHDLLDRKDKIRTRLFQRKIEFLFDTDKLRRIFESGSSNSNNDDTDSTSSSTRTSYNGYILNEWRRNTQMNNAYLSYMYECENDASTLFKCKLCNRHMTRSQSSSLKCTHTLLDRHGELVYMHCADDRFDLHNFLRSVKENLKTWPAVYWFVWSLVKSFRCRKCFKWFRLVDANRCRLNEFTLCVVHDHLKAMDPITAAASQSSSSCTCMFSDHLIDTESIADILTRSPVVVNSMFGEDSKSRLNKYVQYLIDCFEKVKEIVLASPGAEKSPCDSIELGELNKSIDKLSVISSHQDKGAYKTGKSLNLRLFLLFKTVFVSTCRLFLKVLQVF